MELNVSAIYTGENAAAHSKAFVGSTYSVCQIRIFPPAVKYLMATSLSSILCNRTKSEVLRRVLVYLQRFFFVHYSGEPGFWLPLAIGGPCVLAQGLECASALLGECFGTLLPTLTALGSSYRCFPWLVSLICGHGAQPVATVPELSGGMFCLRSQSVCPYSTLCATGTPCLLCSMGFHCGVTNPSSWTRGNGFTVRGGLD